MCGEAIQTLAAGPTIYQTTKAKDPGIQAISKLTGMEARQVGSGDPFDLTGSHNKRRVEERNQKMRDQNKQAVKNQLALNDEEQKKIDLKKRNLGA